MAKVKITITLSYEAYSIVETISKKENRNTSNTIETMILGHKYDPEVQQMLKQ